MKVPVTKDTEETIVRAVTRELEENPKLTREEMGELLFTDEDKSIEDIHAWHLWGKCLELVIDRVYKNFVEQPKERAGSIV